MEGVIIVLLFIFGGVIIRGIIAAGKSAVTGKSFAESYRGFSDFEVRLVDNRLDELDADVKDVEVKGAMPVEGLTDIGFAVLLLDVTDSNNKLPVISLVDDLQAENNILFCHSGIIGTIDANQGLKDWVRISGLILPTLQTPYSGHRLIEVTVCFYDANNKPDFSSGMLASANGIVCFEKVSFTETFSEIGYKEEGENDKEARLLTIQIAMGLAFSDGSFDSSESQVIKDWAKKNIDAFPEDQREALKTAFNIAFKESYQKAKEGTIDINSVTKRLAEIGDKKSKYDALELCHSVMAADDEIDSQEIKFINDIASKLGVSMDALKRMKDSLIVNLGDSIQSSSTIENILGIDPSWDNETVRTHLRKEFQKWNNRINTLSEGSERENAQLMLDKIAEARKKYK